MRMPQDFLDAINTAVRGVDPNAPQIMRGSFTLGTDFDRWLGPEALKKWGLGPLPPEEQTAFEKKFNEVREELKAQLVASAVEVAKRRLAGDFEEVDPLSVD